MWFSEHFSRQNLLGSLSSLLFLLRWNKNGAKKCLENHIPFDFWDDSILANQGAGKTIEKPLKELAWNQQLLTWTTLCSQRPQVKNCTWCSLNHTSKCREIAIYDFSINILQLRYPAELVLHVICGIVITQENIIETEFSSETYFV